MNTINGAYPQAALSLRPSFGTSFVNSRERAGMKPVRIPLTSPDGDVFFSGKSSGRSKKSVSLLGAGVFYLMTSLFNPNPVLAQEVAQLNGQVSPVAALVQARPGQVEDLFLGKTQQELNAAATDDDQARMPSINVFSQRELVEYMRDRTVQIKVSGDAYVDPSQEVTPAEFDNSIYRLGSGSGFFIRRHGGIITNAHVVEEAWKRDMPVFIIRANREHYVAKVKAIDFKGDLAYLEITDSPGKTFPTFKLIASSDEAFQGDFAAAMGTPYDDNHQFTYTMGILTGKDRIGMGNVDKDSKVDVSVNQDQMQTSIAPGNSGGPVAGNSGYVIGVVQGRWNNHGEIHYTIPADRVGKFMAAYDAGLVNEDKSMSFVEPEGIDAWWAGAFSEFSQYVDEARRERHQTQQALALAQQRMDNFTSLTLANTPEEQRADLNPVKQKYEKALKEAQERFDKEDKQYQDIVADFEKAKAAQAIPIRSGGVILTKIDDNKLAGQIGLQPMDILAEVNGEPVTPANFLKVIKSHYGFERVELTVHRDGRLVTLVLNEGQDVNGPAPDNMLIVNDEEGQTTQSF